MLARPSLLFAAVLAFAPASLAAKDIVILMDGTWNNSIDYGGRPGGLKALFRSDPPLLVTDQRELISPLPPQATNIARMFLLLNNNAGQRLAYVRGIGSGEREKFTGGAFGKGADERVEAAVKFIQDNWQNGDEICIFGFSRGAAIARQLARRTELNGKTIRFLGLFDTVAAFGLPETRMSPGGFRKEFTSFYDKLKIPDNVETVVHLVALDENRLTFLPTLISKEPINTPRRKEIWFSGNHGDVGGGWDDEPSATYRRRQIALHFMLKQNHGLDLQREWETEPDVTIDTSWRQLGKNHADRSYGFVEGYGGKQERKNVGDEENRDFAVPYRPSLSSEFVHPSARR